MHPTLNDTLELVKNAHGKTNAVDKGGETPYYWHLLRVMLRLGDCDENTKHIALLHDIIEDTDITLSALKDLGYNDKVVDGVKWCSRNMFPELTFSQWMQKIGNEAPQEAILVKIADIADNLGYERMNGLRGKKTGITKPKKIHQYPLQARIDKVTRQTMRLSGEMGVFDRYYKGWNHLFENVTNLPLVKQVWLDDFCELSLLQEIHKWLPREETDTYLQKNKIHTWQIKGVVEIIESKTGQPYVALTIDNSVGEIYQNFIKNHIDSSFIDNQQNRDRNSFHITLINAMQYGSMCKKNQYIEEVTSLVGQEFKLFTYGIGTAVDIKKGKQAWFAVMENSSLEQFRNKLMLPKQDFHITLAFDGGDVFGVAKDRSSVIYRNEEIGKHVILPNISLKKNHKIR